ncbi:hypothetical protein GUJ93_ZPchr0010g7762 [Zizania palustris]|uniref:Uncharacterized protein n=1 Tax=Zizania palustris TaxID=103762 RepID=A0A8J5W1B8_ZIZPA|nr:hypothetical protein GUJ93_ZPchr0010g7762 [Zizania palustris]
MSAEAEGGVDAAVKGKGKAAPLAGGGGGRGRFVAYPPQMAGHKDVVADAALFRAALERLHAHKFTFKDSSAADEDDEKKDEAGTNAAKKTAGSDSEDDDQDAQQKKEGGLSNKQKKIQRRMKIAELKQICNRPDGVPLDESSFESIVVFMSNIFNLNA